MLTRDKNHPGEKRNKTANVNVKKKLQFINKLTASDTFI